MLLLKVREIILNTYYIMENCNLKNNVSYTAAQKKAIMTYRSKNKDYIQQQNKLYYEKQKLDPDFMFRKRETAKLYYLDCKKKVI